MLYLIGSIVLTSWLTLAFKMVERFGVPVLQAIVINHITCVITGSLVHGSFPIDGATVGEAWVPWAAALGCLFMIVFNVVGFVAQRISVSVATVVNKLSLVVPFVFSLYLYDEPATFGKIAGIVLALVAVVFTCIPANKMDTVPERKIAQLLRIGLILFLFAGSGGIDTLIKYTEQRFLGETNNNTFLIGAFASASFFGTLALLYLFATKKQTFTWKSIPAGIAIGIPNYFSIWCLVHVLKQYAGNSSAIIPINNMGIVLFTALMALLMFRERLSAINWIGIFLSVIAIALIAYG